MKTSGTSLLVLILFCIAGRGQVCFNPIAHYQGGYSSGSLTSADFNKDGIVDIAVANRYADKFTLLLGLGAGAFTTAANFNTGTIPYWITSADFNKDTNPDVAVAHEGSEDFYVFLGNGAGGFAPPDTFPTASEASSVTAADLNGDANLDMIVTQFHFDSLGIFLGDGTGNFTVKGYYSTGFSSESEESVVADVNEDGIPDLVVGNWGGFVSVLTGDGTGAFPTTDTFNTNGIKATCAITGDFDGDAHLDIAACNFFSNDVSILLGDGAGNFSSSVDYPVGGVKPYMLSLGDFNGDGIIDLVTANEGTSNISVLIGNGQGGFGQPAVFSGVKTTNQPIVADFNGDGRIDIAATNIDTNRVSVFLNAPPPVVTANASADTICVGNQVTLYGSGASTYYWTGGVINAVAFSPTVTATYTVTGTDNLGCTNIDSLTVTVNICTGLGYNSQPENLVVYPNPTTGTVIIETNSDNIKLALFDTMGERLWTGQAGQKLALDVSQLAAGAYLLRAYKEGRVESKKLFILK